MSGKFALVIANTEYVDTGLAKLSAPGKDAEDFARVLKDHNICAFDEVRVVLNQPEHIVRRAIEVYFSERKPSDLVVFYFSGHGIRDELGALYLAVKNTVRSRLRSTAIKSDYVREIMDQSRSKRQVLILDCCNSGAFVHGTKSAVGGSMGTLTAFGSTGSGRIILTASDSTQFAWEGDQVIGATQNSLFTYFLVKGLEGEADEDGDGTITIDELYDYAYEQIVSRTPKQTPGKWSFKQQGEIALRQSTRIEDIKPIALPADLIDEVEDTRPYVREAAVQKLEKLVKGKNIALAHSAREALEKIVVDENTTRRVAQAAAKVLESLPAAEQGLMEQAKAEAEELARKKLEEESLAQKRANAIRMAQQRDNYEQRSRPVAKPFTKQIPEQKSRRLSTVWMIVLLGAIALLSYPAIQILRNSSLFSTPPTEIPVTGQSARPSASPEVSTVISIQPVVAVPTDTSIPLPSSTATPTLSVPTSTPTLSIPSNPADVLCNAASKRLSVGGRAEVVTITLPLKLREKPSSATIIEEMPPGTIVSVIGGPYCSRYASGYFWWWNVQAPSGKIGWIVDGHDKDNPVYFQPVN